MKMNSGLRLRLLALVFIGFACWFHAGAAPTPPTSLLVLNKGDHSLAIVDPATMQVVGQVPAGEDIHEVIASVDGKLAFVSNYGGGHTLSVIDVAKKEVVQTLSLGWAVRN
jgi:DNA-binding beta-propeller fold protein YncE